MRPRWSCKLSLSSSALFNKTTIIEVHPEDSNLLIAHELQVSNPTATQRNHHAVHNSSIIRDFYIFCDFVVCYFGWIRLIAGPRVLFYNDFNDGSGSMEAHCPRHLFKAIDQSEGVIFGRGAKKLRPGTRGARVISSERNNREGHSVQLLWRNHRRLGHA